MKRLTNKIKPVGGFSQIAHLLLTVILPASVYMLIRLNLVQLAVILILLSKWRIVSVRPRYWLPLLRSNAVDIIVGLSTVIFMINTSSGLLQLIFAVAYASWLVLIKPSSSIFGISLQAFIALIYGLVATYLEWGGSTAAALVFLTWLVCYSTARHFFSSFDEPKQAFLSNLWAFFGGALAFVLVHDLLYFSVFSQVNSILIVLGFGLGSLYYLSKADRQAPELVYSLLFIMFGAVAINLYRLIAHMFDNLNM